MSNKSITFDAVTSKRVDRIYQNPDIVAQRQFTLTHLRPKAGDHILDIGCGPGLLALEIAALVGPNGNVIGLDPSASMRAIAQERCKEIKWISIVDGDAISIPCEDASQDSAIATQVYEFVPDIASAIAEAFRVLKPGGQLVVLDTDWDSAVIRTNDRERMQTVLQSRRDHFVHPDLPTRLPYMLKNAGFTIAVATGTPIVNTTMTPGNYSEEVLRSTAKLASRRDDLPENTAEEWLAELSGLDKKGEFFFSLTRFLFIAQKPC